ncbi:MAG: DUF4363 family protein [Ruminococcus flavefaciens]|nr:DUF4363 family protein [Ruminococcus flavefaciens]MCM1228868.1 DUF4363 family protein [Ruminococcus flavefaciens]
MTRIKISAFIICLLIFISIFSGIWINKKCKSLIELSAQAEEFFSSDEKDRAIATAGEIESEWESFRRTACVLVRNNKLSEIDRICARIKHLAENDSEELLSELTELEHILDLLRYGEIPVLTSIF